MKKVFFALFAVVIAVGGSAFTNANVPEGTIYGSTSSGFSKRTTVIYKNTDCQDNTTRMCAYKVTQLGENFVTLSNYTDAQLSNFESLGYVEALPGAKAGIYTAP